MRVCVCVCVCVCWLVVGGRGGGGVNLLCCGSLTRKCITWVEYRCLMSTLLVLLTTWVYTRIYFMPEISVSNG